MNIGFFGSCQLHLCSNFFINDEVKKKNNIHVKFSIPFYEYDNKYPGYKNNLKYDIFDDLDILIIENNNLDNIASSGKIIEYCRDKKIKIIKTFLIKFPIYPINWSGYGENISDYKNWGGLDNIDYKKKFKECIESCRESNILSDLSTDITDFIEKNYNKKLLFTHSLHPTNILLYELWRNIFKKLNLNIDDYDYIFENELIKYWYNPFTTKMIADLNILFDTIVDDNFYIQRFNKNKSKFIK
jgi:hypothetical protein